MGIEKQGSKGGGGYVGGLLNLFDWNAKSRKKLFPSKSDLPDQPKQKKRSDGNLPMTRFHMIDDDDNIGGSSIRGSSDYSCASSVTDEEGYGSKAPGVIARLMGLDSLPTSNFSETQSTTSFDSQSIRDRAQAHFEVRREHQVAYPGPGPLRSTIEPKPQKISRPIEKFQTETLPPKSAKSIPITHHKLLSPIKSSGFVPSSSNAAYIMEAAAKIIESGRQNRQSSMTTAVKMPLVGSSSAPLKVKDLKEKVEASRKPSPKLPEASRRSVESNAAKYFTGQSMNKSWNGSADSKSTEDENSTYSKSKGKSISLALQAKVNVQKREGLTPGGTRSFFGEKIENNTSSQPNTQRFGHKKPLNHNASSSSSGGTESIFGEKVENNAPSQPNAQRRGHKKPSTPNASSSSVLRQNNQKQNGASDRGKLPSKTVQNKNPVTINSSLGRQKSNSKLSTNSKGSSRKMGAEIGDSKKEVPYFRRKRSINGDFHLDKNNFDNVDKGRKVIQSGWDEESKRNGTDVISFTFTAPMARSTLPSPERSREEALQDFRGKKVMVNSDGNNGSKLSYNVIGGGGGDALSTLLEQKLRELTYGVESSRHRAGTAGSSVSIFHDMVPNFKAGSTTPVFQDKRRDDQLHLGDSSTQASSAFSSNDPLGLMRKHKLQDVEDAYSNFGDPRKFLDHRHPSPISVLEPSFLAESCNSSDTIDSYSTEGYKQQSSSVQAQEIIGTSFAELSDSASSTIITVTRSSSSNNRELEYVKTIISNIDEMFKDFIFGRTQKIINPQLFDQLEDEEQVVDEPKHRRKVLFDCVNECVDSRCRVWAKGLAVVERKEQLAKDVYKEITGWEELAGDTVVDELVDKDMSCGTRGRWLDFDVEMFELGIEIEKRILNSLINEVVADMLLL